MNTTVAERMSESGSRFFGSSRNYLEERFCDEPKNVCLRTYVDV